jgi:hypothetical protein
VLLMPVDKLPCDAVIQANRAGIRIAGERTGHAHQLVGDLAVAGDRHFVRGGNVLQHEEHEHIVTAPIWYEVRGQVEHVPESRPRHRFD